MKTQRSCVKTQFLRQLVDETLSERERMDLEDHIETCKDCQHALDTLVEADETAERVVRQLRRTRPAPGEALQDVMDHIRSTNGDTIAHCPIPLDDFAVDYLHPADSPDSLGRIGPYEVSQVIGSGGMGIVLKGNDTKLHRVVAIKVLAPTLAMNPTARKRFLREAQAAAAVGHPNVVTIYSVDEDRLPYLVMEFVDGPSLQERLDKEGVLHLDPILRIGVQVAAGLAAAHAQGLVHRDVKPGNILLERGIERVRLTDFGLARAADDASMTREGTVVGTPQYMSPEQARGESVDQTSDLFSLGSVLYALATGRPPFRAETSYGVMRKIIDESPTSIRELNPEVPEWLSAIIERLMAKQREDRFQSAAEVHSLLESCLSHTQQPTAKRLPEIPKSASNNRTFPSPMFLAGVIAMLTLATGLLLAAGVLPIPFADPKPDQEKASVNTKPVGAQPHPTSLQQRGDEAAYEKQFVVEFANPNEVGTLNVDIKRGSIDVTGYDGDKVVVQLTVPATTRSSKNSPSSLKELRPNNIDFDIEKSKDEIKVDGNSYETITNLRIRVPRKTNLILDSYRDGIITVQNVEGHFNLRSQNNDIRLRDVSGSARLRGYNGSLKASFEAINRDGTLDFETYNGSIDVMLPSDTRADVRYRSGSGKVTTDFEIALSDAIVRTGDGKIEIDQFVRGTLRGGGSSLILDTEKGDIRLLQRMQTPIR